MNNNKNSKISLTTSLRTRIKGLQKKSIAVWTCLLLVASGGYYEANINSQVKLNFVEGSNEVFFTQLEATKKKGLIFFYTDYCFPCQTLDELFLKNSRLASSVNQSFIPYRVDGFDKVVGDALKDKYDIKHFPTLLITDENGVERARLDLYDGSQDFVKKFSSITGLSLPIESSPVTNTSSEFKKELGLDERIEQKYEMDKNSYSLSLESYDSYDQARSYALLKTKLWKKEIWIEQVDSGKYELMLGMFAKQKEGEIVQKYLATWEGIESEMRTLNGAQQIY